MRILRILPLLILLSLLFPPPANAQVVVSRQGDENPAISVTKSIFWGGLGGLLLGGAVALATDEDDGEILKWSFVGGTFAGLALGLWHVTHRPEPRGALLRIDSGGTLVSAPPVEWKIARDPLAGSETVRIAYVPVLSLRR